MAEESNTIRNINWREVFPFTNIFRSFRVAAHPSKLILALLALAVIWVGGKVLDKIWPVSSRAVPGEIAIYQEFAGVGREDQFAAARDAGRKAILNGYEVLLMKYDVVKTTEKATELAQSAGGLGELKSKILSARDKSVKEANELYIKRRDEVKDKDSKTKATAMDDATKSRDAAIRGAYAEASNEYEAACYIKNSGLFAELFEYQINQANGVVGAVWRNDWFGAGGVIASVKNFLTVGPIWLVKEHTVFFVLFGLLLMVSMAVFGGAICRIAAIHVARDEKISLRQALMFSAGKLLSFTFAPIIPLLIVVGIGLFITLVSLLGNLPLIGTIFVGGLLIAGLAAGFVMTLVLLGTAGGFNLMFPTIAVEGSDSFDAISRSFSYLYARPWRLAFYTGVAIAYGAITYLFVRMFIYLMLVMTHHFIGMGIFRSADNTAPLWSTIWPSPAATGRLLSDPNFMNLSFGQSIGAFLVAMWVFLIIGLLGAYAISFYFSSSTIIYYLMRHEVDATEMDDVYIEQADDDLAEPTAAPAKAATTETPAAEAPAPAAPESGGSTPPPSPAA